MSYIKNGTYIIKEEAPRICSYCKKKSETRPFGVGGVRICYDCGHKPENIEETNRQLAGLFGSPTKTQT